jgi:citrate synthase
MLINVDSTIHERRPRFVGADEAARILGVKVPTLYAYVSRGLVRSVGGSRAGGHAYLREDLERLAARKRARAGHAAVAATALRWGEPVLESAITAIDERGPRYRGHPAVDLVRAGRTFEEAAELLWNGELGGATPWRASNDAAAARVRRVLRPSRPILRMLAPLAAAAASEKSPGGSRASEIERARALVTTVAAHVGPRRIPPRRSVASTVCAALGISTHPSRVAAVDAALVLLADHELNASSFAARVAASAGAGLAGCLLAAFATSSGHKHGAASEEVEQLLDEVGSAARARAVLGPLLREGRMVPGFHHTLYPKGDPRAVPLLALARRLAPRARSVALCDAVARHVARARGDRPNVDFGLVALARALRAPRGAAALLFALGRTAGWVAHALEQREQGFLLRPRARYVGA